MAADRSVVLRPALERLSVASVAPSVDHAERRCRQRHEHSGMLRDGLGDALAAAQPGCDELVRIAAVSLRARPADGLAPVATRLAQHAVRLAVRAPDDLPVSAAAARLDRAAQPNR